ncbi:class A beta-lactamase [Hephaestia sp. GCM10023244]|uniref:class A beta-lactamase n=1 Tax=unclassified Hephaestia TaxID=2631281 RepID=UPI0020770A57|nr:class A beta-lactamase [Hephaestia sp. MAHUQ-44]MCM8730419.1 class A beta-lactamase [Hephaestia sp. MAHUQ-44]
MTKPAVLAAALLVLLAGCRSDDRTSATIASVGHVAQPNYTVKIPVPPAPVRIAAPQPLVAAIEAIGTQFDGKVGIAVQSINQGWTVSSNGEVKLPQQSVSKLWVAITMLDLRDQGRLTLDDPVTVTKADLTLFHQPIAGLVGDNGYRTTVRDLQYRAITSSDNTANDRLLSYVGGPEAVRAMIARKQLGAIRFGPGERLLQSHTAGLTWQQRYSLAGAFQQARAALSPATRAAAFDAYVADPIDGASANAIVDALARLVKGELLSPSSTQWLIKTMSETRTGAARLRASLPGGWSIAHKTGTGQDFGRRTAGFNDVGVLTAPDGRRYTVAVMIGDTSRPVRERQQLIQSVARAVIATDTERAGMVVAQQPAPMSSSRGAN